VATPETNFQPWLVRSFKPLLVEYEYAQLIGEAIDVGTSAGIGLQVGIA
jgi:hypothetical protein